MKKMLVVWFLVAGLVLCSSVSADTLRTIRIERPEFPGYVEEFQEMDVLGGPNLSHDLPDLEIGKVYEYTHHRVCLDGVDIGVTYHETVLKGPTTETPYLIQVRLGPDPAKILPNIPAEKTDVTRDGKIDEADLLIVMVCKSNSPNGPTGDVDGNKTVDQVDLDLVYKFFGAETLSTQKDKKASTWSLIKGGR